MNTLKYLSIFVFAISSIHAYADEFSGTWKFEKVAEYFDENKKIQSPEQTTVQILDGRLVVSSRCLVTLEKDKFLYSAVFQGFLKQGIDKAKLDQYLQKKFSFDLFKVKTFYETNPRMSDCSKPFENLIVSDNRLITAYANSFFYSFTRSDGEASKAILPNVMLYGHKLSHLPFSTQNFEFLCRPLMTKVKGVPQPTEKCAPIYFPYVATKKNLDPLTKLIGMHNYKRGGASHAEDYDNPLANNLHPTYLIFPPLKDVLLVRVEDYEPGPNENRDPMAGVYLAIKDGKVTGQLNEGCDFNEKYFCVDADGKQKYQLLENGKFKTLN